MNRTTKFRRLTSGFLCLVMVLTIILTAIPLTASAEEDAKEHGNLLYKVEKGEITIVGCYTDTEGNVSIPAVIDVYPVTKIGESAFASCNLITGVTIPSTVTSIGKNAFAECQSLKNINIPSSVTSIGDYAFIRCYNLENIIIPASVKTIGTAAFSECNKLSSITIPEGVTDIGGHAFYDCENISYASISGSVHTIGAFAFSYCSNLETVSIHKGVKIIGESAFSGCIKLSGITIPNSVTSIGTNAFRGCEKFESIIIPGSVYSIGMKAFFSCTSLTSLTIEYGVKVIDSFAFSDTKIVSLTIPGSVTTIESCAFLNVTSLKTLVIEDGVKVIGESAFFSINDNEIDIPSSVTNIGDYAFGNGTLLILPGGTMTIYNSINFNLNGGSVKLLNEGSYLVRERNSQRLVVAELRMPNGDNPTWTDVTGLYDKDGNQITYNIADMTTDNEGKLYIWLPNNTTLKAIAAGNRMYYLSNSYLTVNDKLDTSYVFKSAEYSMNINVYFTDGSDELDPCSSSWQVKTDGYNIVQYSNDNEYSFYITSYDDYTKALTTGPAARYALFYTLPDGYTVKGLYANGFPAAALNTDGFTSSGGFGVTPRLYYFNVDSNTEINVFIGQEGHDTIAPAILEKSLPDCVAGVPYEYKLQASYTSGGDNLSFEVVGDLPDGISLSQLSKPVIFNYQIIGYTNYYYIHGTTPESGVFEFDIVTKTNNTQVSRRTVTLSAIGNVSLVFIDGDSDYPIAFEKGIRQSYWLKVKDPPIGQLKFEWKTEGSIPNGMMYFIDSKGLCITGIPEEVTTEPLNLSFTAWGSVADDYTYYGFASLQIEVYHNRGLNDNDTPDDTSDDVYEIADANDLYLFAARVNSGNTDINAKLMNDINLNPDYTFASDGTYTGGNTPRSWTPIGSSTNRFEGSFEGNGKTISGLYYNNESMSNIGIIGFMGQGASIANVTLSNSYIYGNSGVGGICGESGLGTVTSCTNNGAVSGSGNNVGGICGIGKTVTSCINTGAVSGKTFVGGICGNFFNDIITLCTNSGAVSGSGNNVGGICGNSSGTISYCENNGEIYGSQSVGGICGLNDNILTYCINTGAVDADNDKLGGICGNTNLTTSYCLNVGTISKTGDNISDICGVLNGGSLSYCYYLGVSESDGRDGTTFKTAQELASGAVAWLLNTSGGAEANTEIWSQGAEHPIFADETHKATYKISIQGGIQTETYSDGNGKAISLPKGYTFEFSAAPFTEETLVTADIAIQATKVLVIVKGDIDGDGEVAPADISMLIAARLETITLSEAQIAVADIDGNGEIEPNDISLLIAFRLGTITELP